MMWTADQPPEWQNTGIIVLFIHLQVESHLGLIPSHVLLVCRSCYKIALSPVHNRDPRDQDQTTDLETGGTRLRR